MILSLGLVKWEEDIYFPILTYFEQGLVERTERHPSYTSQNALFWILRILVSPLCICLHYEECQGHMGMCCHLCTLKYQEGEEN